MGSQGNRDLSITAIPSLLHKQHSKGLFAVRKKERSILGICCPMLGRQDTYTSSSDYMFALGLLPSLSHRPGNVLVFALCSLCLLLFSPIAVRNLGGIPSCQPHSSECVLLSPLETVCASL